MSNAKRFVALNPNGKRLGTYGSRDAASGACQDAVIEGNEDEDTASEYSVVECNSIGIIVVGPELTRESISPSQYKRLCERLERCYTHYERDTQYSVRVRPTRAGEAPGTYYREESGNLQLLGYTIEVPEDLHELNESAWNLFASGKRIPR